MRKVTQIFDIISSHWFDCGLDQSQQICSLADVPNCSAQLPDYAVIDRLRDTMVCVPTPSLSGYRFCDLRRIQHIEPNDRFLISKTDYFKEMNGRVENGPKSMNVSYQTLSTSLARDMHGKFDVNSLAYRDWWEYSEVNHHHDLMYNSIVSVQCVNDYLHDNGTVSVMANISCGLSTEGISPCKVYQLSCPADQYIPMEEPAIGSIRFIYKQKTFDVDSDNFDGWVPADGTTYSAKTVKRDFAERFEKALYTFNRGKKGATSFTVPLLSGFYKFTDQYRANGKITDTIPAHCALLSHTHYLSPNEVKLDKDNNNNGTEIHGFVAGFEPQNESIYLYHTAVKGDKFVIPLMHAGRRLADIDEYGVVNLETNIVSLRGKYLYSNTNLPTAIESGKVQLEHDVLPAMIYIGGHMKNYILYEKYHNYRHRLDFMNTYQQYKKELQIIPGGWTSSWTNADGTVDSNWKNRYEDQNTYYTYRSESNLGKDSSVSKLTIKIKNITEFKIDIMSDAETRYDYVVALKLDNDRTISADFSPGLSWVADTTYANGTKSKTVTYTIPDDHEWHTIVVGYRKDVSMSLGTDRGYLSISKLQLK